jgi:hypothetical protein
VRLGDVVDELHDEHGLADAGATEQTDLPALAVRSEKVDDLDARLEDLDLGRLVDELGRFAVDGQEVLRIDRAGLVHGASDHVEDPSEALVAHGHHDGVVGIGHGHAPHEPVRGVHRDGPHRGLTKVLSDLQDQVVVRVRDGRVVHLERVENGRQLAGRKRYVDDGTDDLQNLANVLRGLFLRHETQPPSSFNACGRDGFPAVPQVLRWLRPIRRT